MKFERLTRVVYLSNEGDQVFTFIKTVNKELGVYELDFEDQQVSEDQLKLNTHSVFSVPHHMSKASIKAYHLDQLINQVIEYLMAHHGLDQLRFYREMDTLYFETVMDAPQTTEDRHQFQAKVDHFNRMIGQVNKAVKSRFNRKLEVVFKLPFQNHHLHSIRI